MSDQQNQVKIACLEKEALLEKLRELEKQMDIGLSEKRYESKGLESLN